MSMDKRARVMIKVGAVISAGTGLVMGSLFSAVGMYRSTGHAVPAAVIGSALLSAVISVLVGLIFPMWKISAAVGKKLGTEGKKGFLPILIDGIIGDVIFTPILCTFFVVRNFLNGTIPPEAPRFMIWLGGLGLDLLIALPVTMVTVPLFRSLGLKLFAPGRGRGDAPPSGKGDSDGD